MIRPSFLFFLSYLPKGKVKAVEIGTMDGINAVGILKTYADLDLVCVDIVKKPEAVQVLLPYKDRVQFINKPSVEAAKRFDDNTFDYVYIDGAHDIENVYADMKAWYPKLKINGVMGGHDWWINGVRDGVKRFFDTEKGQYLHAVQHYYNGAIPNIYAEFMDWWFVKLEVK